MTKSTVRDFGRQLDKGKWGQQPRKKKTMEARCNYQQDSWIFNALPNHLCAYLLYLSKQLDYSFEDEFITMDILPSTAI